MTSGGTTYPEEVSSSPLSGLPKRRGARRDRPNEQGGVRRKQFRLRSTATGHARRGTHQPKTRKVLAGPHRPHHYRQHNTAVTFLPQQLEDRQKGGPKRTRTPPGAIPPTVHQVYLLVSHPVNHLMTAPCLPQARMKVPKGGADVHDANARGPHERRKRKRRNQRSGRTTHDRSYMDGRVRILPRGRTTKFMVSI